MNVQRFDYSPLPKAARTDSGLLRAPARLTRSGVLTYRKADGTPYREWRPPEEVFSQASLDSLRTVPVVVGHPAMVTPQNWQSLAKGDVRDDVRADGTFVAATLAINDAQTIADLDSGKYSELSCGYMADIDPTPGVTPDGEKYDAIQRNIRYNHVGLGPKNWGRAGNDVRVILDSGCEEYPTGMDELTKALQAQAKAEAALTQAQAKADGLAAELVTAKAATAKAEGERDAAKARADGLQESIPGLVKARAGLEAAAKGFDPEIVCDGKTDAEIRLAVASKAYPKINFDGKGDEYVKPLFDAALVAERADGGRSDVAGDVEETLRTDAQTATTDSVFAAQQDHRKRMTTWQPMPEGVIK